MADEKLIIALAKVLIAAAWADHELTHDEVNSMKDLLFFLPQLSARQWASLQIYLEAPVGDEERARLVAELQDAISSSEDKALALRTLDEMVHADGTLSGEDEEVAAVGELTAGGRATGAGGTLDWAGAPLAGVDWALLAGAGMVANSAVIPVR